MGIPGRDNDAWFFPFGLDRETYDTVRRHNAGSGFFRRGRSGRDQEAWRADRDALDRLHVATTLGVPGDRTGQLAADVIAAGRAAFEAARRSDRSQEEVWQAKAHITGQVWLAVHLLDGACTLPDEDHTDRARYVQGILDELRALAEEPAV
ncbi:hypothetical protein ADL00_15895 [Streptomyces sp. AS58]|uniref:hypothetical protein n=1 Tax=Streptomyces TaxID=1883 RepID=UPI0006B04254|nr:hypothetical protein [Streptomyces sp. AS58]KOV67301.1 hypothetical protein ADL00_15895 [Streptomyces sp. AS58]